MEEGGAGRKMFVTGQYTAELVNPGDDRFDLPKLLMASQFPVPTTRCCMEVVRLSTSRAKDRYHTADSGTLLTFLSLCGLITSCRSICSLNSAPLRVRRHPARYPVVAVVDSHPFDFPNDIIARAASRYCVSERSIFGLCRLHPVPQPFQKMPCGAHLQYPLNAPQTTAIQQRRKSSRIFA